MDNPEPPDNAGQRPDRLALSAHEAAAYDDRWTA